MAHWNIGQKILRQMLSTLTELNIGKRLTNRYNDLYHYDGS
jgi:hypothetical protein